MSAETFGSRTSTAVSRSAEVVAFCIRARTSGLDAEAGFVVIACEAASSALLSSATAGSSLLACALTASDSALKKTALRHTLTPSPRRGQFYTAIQGQQALAHVTHDVVAGPIRSQLRSAERY